MIDNLTITINDCDCIPPSMFVGSKYYFKKYILHSPLKDNPAYLEVKYDKYRGIVKIIGSVRKWYLGMFSLEDLTAEEFQEAIERIAELLSIDYEKILEGTITKCEIGMNIRTRIPADKVNEVIRNYKRFKYYRYAYETVGFLSDNSNLKLYDKCTELISRFGKFDKEKKAKNRFKRLKELGIYIYRIEVTLTDSRSFELAGMKDLSNIEGLINNYPALIQFWVNECSKIEVGLGINFEDKRMTKDEYAILIGIQSVGYDIFEKEYAERSINKKNDKGKKEGYSAANAISLAKKEISVTLRKYRDPKLYQLTSFRVDIFKTLKRKYGDSPDIRMKDLILRLWAVKNKS